MKRDLFWKNIPGLENNLGFLIEEPKKGRFLKNVTDPFFVWGGSGPISKLDSLELPNETISILNAQGLSFYMYEPLGMRVSEFNGRSYEGEIPNTIPIEHVESNDLNSISSFVKKNNLNNVVVFCCDYNISKIQKRYSNLKLKCLDIFLRSIDYHEEYNIIKNNIIKRFWCGNWRYVPHRHIMTAYLVNFEGNYSWHFNCDYKTIKNNNWINFDLLEGTKKQLLLKGIEILKNNIFSIDRDDRAVIVHDSQEYYIPGKYPQLSEKLIKSYKECFCAVVNESRYASPLGYISEKTLTAINCRLPFILVAAPYTLEYLKTFGFKTFDQWWDESYDKEENHQKRMIMIFDVINYINSKSYNELSAMYEEMKPILKYNLEILKTVPTNKTIL